MIRTNSTNPAIVAATEVVNDTFERLAEDCELVEAGVIPVESSADQAKALWKYWEDSQEGLPKGLELVEGSIFHYPHSWFIVRLPVHEAGLPNWTWIIDPALPMCIPNAIAISPDAPSRLAYMGDVKAGTPLYPME